MKKSTVWSHRLKENFQKLPQLWQQFVDLRSLGWRLTVEIGIVLTIALGIVTAWNSWQMQKILIATHTQNIERIASRFPHDVEIYSEMLATEKAIAKTIDNVANPNLLIWVKDLQRKLVSYSDNFRPKLPRNRELISLASMPHQPQIYQIGNRYVVLCEGNIKIKNRQIGTLYLAQDVTDDRQQLIHTIFQSIGVSLLVLLLILGAIAWRIRHSLSPLARMNKTIGALNLDRLQGVQLQLRNPPSEIHSLAQTFNMILSELAESWEHQRQLVSNVSHELRTPLTIILGYLQSLLRRSTNLTEHQREALTIATAETERTVRLL
jgi:signal transduction histidine kinase